MPEAMPNPPEPRARRFFARRHRSRARDATCGLELPREPRTERVGTRKSSTVRGGMLASYSMETMAVLTMGQGRARISTE